MNLAASLAIVLAALGLTLAYATRGLYLGAVTAGALGILCLIGQRRAWHWTAVVGLIGFTGAAVVGVWLSLPAVWMLLSTVTALAAWDLVGFANRIRSVPRIDAGSRPARAHLMYLVAVCGVAILSGMLALGVGVTLSFGWALLLGAVVLLGLSFVMTILRRA